MTARDELGLGWLVRVFAALSVLLVASLVVAALKSYRSEWRQTQQKYNEHAVAKGQNPLAIGLKQIWRPDLLVTDRCTSCHVAMGGASPFPDTALFAAHPPIPHDVREIGCTVCHGGQGRATYKLAAHGQMRFWDLPLLPKMYTEAGCGSCHSHLRVPSATDTVRGQQIVAEQECAICHDASRRLDDIGLRGFRVDWHERHIGMTKGDVAFAPLLDEDVVIVSRFLEAQVGAPKLMAGKMLAHHLGCRGCHRIGGVGAEEGPHLDGIGLRSTADLDFTGVQGEHTLSGWLTEHFLDPAKVVKDSRMPKLDLTQEQAELLTLYMLSLRARDVPDEWTPKDRVRVTKLGAREFATDGESLYLAFCVACHGERGVGRTLALSSQMAPAIGRAEFLAVADDAFIRKSAVDGRPGRPMPSWGRMDGGLRVEEIDAIVTYLRSLQPRAPSFDSVMALPADIEDGNAVFARACAACHGDHAEGTKIAPPLAAHDNLTTRSENAIYGTLVKGVAGTAMGSFLGFEASTLRNLIAAVRSFPKVQTSRDNWKAIVGDAPQGEPLYAKHCATCHGDNGEGKDGPALANAAFLSAASDGYLIATIIRGRPDVAKEMPAFGTRGENHERLNAGEVADIVAWLRSWEPARGAGPKQGNK